MDLMLNRPARVAVHPGGILEDAIRDRGTTAAHLSAGAGIPVATVEAIVAERAPITAETALRLAAYFGTSAELWTSLQAGYDLDSEQARLGAELTGIVGLAEA